MYKNIDDTLFQSAEDIYEAIGDNKNEQRKKDARLLLELRDGYIRACEFDPRTGQPLPRGLFSILHYIRHITENKRDGFLKDRFARIIDHSGGALQAIINKPREKVFREHTMVPIYAAREIDSSSVQWLSRRPGRTLREKLAGKPYVKAVNRRMCLDTAENRLLKAFLHKLEQVFLLRNNALGRNIDESDFELLQLIQRWFHDDDAREIGSWSNLPPNNTLLQDRNYRRVWDAWLWLQALDENVQADHKRLYQDWRTLLFWTIVAALDELEQVRFMEQPCFFEYDKFCIHAAQNVVSGMVFPLKDLLTGCVTKIAMNDSYGFLRSDQHERVFFHFNDFCNHSDFEKITEGSLLSFSLKEGPKGVSAKKIRFAESPRSIQLSFYGESEIQISIYNKTVRIDTEDREVVLHLNDGSYLRVEKMECSLLSVKKITEQVVSFLFGYPYANLSKRLEPKTNSGIENTNVILDLCSTRPKFVAGSGTEQKTPFRLLRQYWSVDNHGTIPLDLANTNAMTLRSDITTVSMLSLFSEYGDRLTGLLSDAAMAFAERLHEFLKPTSLTYLVPDSINDFSLESIRRSINSYFPDSQPLPKSIAAVFAWQASKSFHQTDFEEGDCVLVLENIFESMSVTPLVGFKSPELQEIIPESNGFHWERHPSITVSAETSVNIVKKTLDKDDCDLSNEIANLFGFDGVIDELDSLSWIDDKGRWYNLPANIIDRLRKESANNNIALNDILRVVRTVSHYLRKNATIYLLPIGDSFKQPNEKHSFKWLGAAWSLTKGGQTLERWQLQAGEIPLWSDHLPELSMKVVRDGRFDQFYLVQNKMIIPQRGKRVTIPVTETFTLPAGQTHYQFPLMQGAGGRELQYMAYLKSPSFPLNKDTVCDLIMTYTYGADDPYELQFVPTNPHEAGFKSVRVEWREHRKIEAYELIAPGFPVRYEWEDYESYPDAKKETTNLLEWIATDLNYIKNLNRFVSGDGPAQVGDRLHANIGGADWFQDKNGYWCCKRHFAGYGEIFFHQENYEVFDMNATDISFELDKYNRARKISLGRSLAKDTVHRLRRSIRFPVITVWNQGHSLSEIGVPDWFRRAMQEGINNSLALISQMDGTDLGDELFFFICCLHRDMPGEVVSQLLAYSKDKQNIKKYYRNIAFAIGDAQLEWQRQLLGITLSFINDKGLTRSLSLQVLSIVFWRVDSLIHRLSDKEISSILGNLLDSLEDMNFHQHQSLTKYLELLLALLRTRNSGEENIKRILAPEKDITKKFAAIVDEVTERVFDANLDISSRISLQIDKPEAFHNTPDLLYALRMYLTGDSGANAIRVTGVSDED